VTVVCEASANLNQDSALRSPHRIWIGDYTKCSRTSVRANLPT